MVWMEGGPFEENRGGGVEERAVGDVGVASDPTDIRRAPVDIFILLPETQRGVNSKVLTANLVHNKKSNL